MRTATPSLAAIADPARLTKVVLPDLGGLLTVVDGALWDATDSGPTRIDPKTGTVSEPLTGITNLAFAGGRLWGGGEDKLSELDPATGKVVRSINLRHHAYYLAATSDTVWTTDTTAGVIDRVDVGTGNVVASITSPANPKGTTLGERSLWVACDGADTVIRIDPTANKIVARIAVGSGPHNIAIGGGFVWVTNRHSLTLSKIDPATNTVVATVDGVAASPAVGVAVEKDRVYVGSEGAVVVVDAARAEIVDRIAAPETAFYDLKVVDGRLWASDANSSTLFGFDLGT